MHCRPPLRDQPQPHRHDPHQRSSPANVPAQRLQHDESGDDHRGRNRQRCEEQEERHENRRGPTHVIPPRKHHEKCPDVQQQHVAAAQSVDGLEPDHRHDDRQQADQHAHHGATTRAPHDGVARRAGQGGKHARHEVGRERPGRRRQEGDTPGDQPRQGQ